MKVINFLNPLGFYGYKEEREFNPIQMGISISADDKIISVTEDGSLLGIVKLGLNDNKLSLIGKDGTEFSTVEIPTVQVVKNAYYDDDKEALIIEVGLEDGSSQIIEVPFNNLLDDYATKAEVQKNAEDIATVNTNLVTAINTINKNVSDGFTTLNAGIKGNELRIEALENQMSGATASVEEEAKKREEADKKLNETIAIVNSNLVTAINNYNNVVLPKITSDLNNAIMGETSARTEADQKLSDSIASSVSTINTTVQKLRDDVTAALNQIGQINANQNDRLTALESAISGDLSTDEIKQMIEDEKNRATEAENALKELVENYNSTQSAITDALNERVNELEEKIASMESGTSDIDSAVSDLAESIGKLTDDINTVNGRVDTLTTNVQTMINQVNENVANSINALNKNMVDAINTINGGIDEVRGDLQEESSARQETDTEIRELLNQKVGWTEIADRSRATRKAIIMENHDALMGKGTDGTVYNLAMLSKWNKADFGSASVLLNLNGKGERPTYNDTSDIALVSDIQTSMGEIRLTKDENNVYTLYVGENAIGTIEIPKDKFIKSVDFVSETKELVIVFETDNGEQTTRIDMSELVDTYTAGNGLSLAEGVFSVMLDDSSEAFLTVSPKGVKLSGIQEAIDRTVADKVAQSEADTDKALGNKVDWTDISNESNPGRRSIVLKNHDMLLGTDTKGATYNIGMVSKWDVVDLGTASLPMNLNTPKGVRVTVQEQGQTGEQANKIAYLSDVDLVVGSETDGKDELSLYGVKAYAASMGDTIEGTVDTKIENAVAPISAQMGNFVTEEEAAQYHDQAIQEAKDYTDASIAQNSAVTVNEAVNKAAENMEAELSGITSQQEKDANRITSLENRSDHYDYLFSQILEEHSGETITLDFYTKAETDEKISGAVTEEQARAEEAEANLQKQLDSAVMYSDISTPDNAGRKAITLKNHDTLLGTATNGSAYNLAMVSKWDKADFGTGSLPINLNGSETRPTYNDEKEIALLEYVQGVASTISLVKDNDLQYTLHVGDAIAGTINIPKDQFLKSVSYDDVTKVLNFVFETKESESSVDVNIADLVDTYAAGNGLSLASNEFSIKIDATTQKYIEVGSDGLKIVGIDEALVKKVSWGDIATEENPGRKAITLGNHDTILGATTSGGSVNIAMVSKWDKVDLGSTQVSINLNGKDTRPTYNDEKEIALVEDIPTVPTELPNPETLTLKLNGTEVGSYKGDETKEINLVVNAKTVPMSDEDATTVYDKIDTLKESVQVDIPLRTLQDRIYTQEEILNWFHVETVSDLRTLATREGQFYVEYGITLQGVQNYKMPVEYVEYMQPTNEIKLVFLGLDTHDDSPAKYTIQMNLNGTVLEGNSNVKIVIEPLDKEIDLSGFATKEEISGLASKADLDAEVTARGEADTQLQNDIEAEAQARLAKDNELESKVDKKVEWSDIATDDNPNRKAITLGNHDAILGETTSGSTVNVAMVSKWDKVDLGSTQVSINLNGKDARPTYNDDKEIALMDDVNAITVPTKVSELENDADYQTSAQVDERIKSVVNSAPEALDTLNELAQALGNDPNFAGTVIEQLGKKADQTTVDELSGKVEALKAPYQINLTDLLSVSDSNAISAAIGGIDALRNVVSENRSVIGDINNGTVPVSVRIIGNVTTVYYVLDSLAGYTMNEINITNTDGTLSKEVRSHSVMTEEMVIDNLTSEQPTLPLSANQGKVLNDKVDEVQAGILKKLGGDLDLNKYLEGGWTCQVINKLEQSYFDDLGEPTTVNGQPYDAETNNYLVGNAYVVFARFGSAGFEQDLYILNGMFDMGLLRHLFMADNLGMDVYDTKLAKLENRIAALENPTT